MADREGRKAELERKKARLLAMRAEKNKKEVSKNLFLIFWKFYSEFENTRKSGFGIN